MAGYGGRQSYPVSTIVHVIENKPVQFAQRQKNSRWSMVCVGGPKTQKGDLGHVNVIEEIRNKVYGLETPGEEDVVEDADVEDDDPMNALEVTVAQQITKVKDKSGVAAKSVGPPLDSM